MSRRWPCAAYRVRKPMGRPGMGLRGSGPSGLAFACKPPAVAKPALAWGRFATQWSAATTSLPSLGGSSAGLTIPHVTPWRGQNWRRVSFCCARVLSHDPKDHSGTKYRRGVVCGPAFELNQIIRDRSLSSRMLKGWFCDTSTSLCVACLEFAEGLLAFIGDFLTSWHRAAVFQLRSLHD